MGEGESPMELLKRRVNIYSRVKRTFYLEKAVRGGLGGGANRREARLSSESKEKRGRL